MTAIVIIFAEFVIMLWLIAVVFYFSSGIKEVDRIRYSSVPKIKEEIKVQNGELTVVSKNVALIGDINGGLSEIDKHELFIKKKTEYEAQISMLEIRLRSAKSRKLSYESDIDAILKTIQNIEESITSGEKKKKELEHELSILLAEHEEETSDQDCS